MRLMLELIRFFQHKIFLPLLLFYRTFCAMKTGRFQAEAKAVRDA